MGQLGKVPGWSCAILGIVAAELAMIADVTEPKKKQMLLTVIRAKVFATFAMLAFDLSFKWVMIHTAGFFILVGILSFNRQKQGLSSYRYFLYGMACLIVMGGVKIGQLDIHPAWFNRDDLSHVIMLAMYWLFFKGVKAYQQPIPNDSKTTIE